MRVGLIRHGRTDWNALGKIEGQTDIPLNEEGIRQARALAERLSGESMRWDAVIASDLTRAHETGRIIAEKLGIPLLPGDPRLRERYFGEVEGTTEEERLLRWGADWRRSGTGQESDDSVRSRALAFIEEAQSARPDGSLLVVTHGSLLAQLLMAMCSELEDKPITNLSLSILERKGSRWDPLLHNCTLHLDHLGANH